MAEFLLEIFCEEIPARMQTKAAEDLKNILTEEAKDRGLSGEGADKAPPTLIKTYVTPRRLVGVIEGLGENTGTLSEERRGPKITAPDNAVQGFLKSVGLKREECAQRDGYYFARLETSPRPAREVLPEIVHAVFAKMAWPKSMIWMLEDKKKSQAWVRPVRSVLAIFGGEALCFPLPSLGLITSNKTRGHRFLAPDSVEITSFADYHAKLQQAFVVLGHQERQSIIREGLQELARQKGLSVQTDEELLQEVAGLVEYPAPLLGQIDAKFMGLPAPVLSTSMRVHQKYFTLVDGEGKIAPYFGVVANTKGTDDGRAMLAGYERVLRARLSDAAFFYDLDKNIPLESLVPKLDNIIFHAKLGSIGQKVKRLVKYLPLPEHYINTPQQKIKAEVRKRAALLAKADLLTHMVQEFPELQGIMGEIYALGQGENSEVSSAIREHYLPKELNDPCPTERINQHLALIDKMDTLVGFFGIGEAPTGSKDPFALRRSALGIIRILHENKYGIIPNEEIYKDIYNAYLEQGIVFKLDMNSCINTIRDFVIDRLIIVLREKGIRHDYVKAIIEGIKSRPAAIQKASYIDLYNIWAIAELAKSLQNFMQTADGASLLTLFRRACIVNAEELKDNCRYSGENLKREDFREEDERYLYDKINTMTQHGKEFLNAHKFEDIMRELANLRPTVDKFFNNLKVNDSNPQVRKNRLNLLGWLVSQIALIADFSKIEK